MAVAPNPAAFLEILAAARASAILRTDLADAAAPAMEAAVRGGFRVIEFTLTTPGALDLVRAFSARRDIVVGAGTVLTVDDARAAVAAGARFLVSPVVDEAVIAAARDLGVAAIPGTYTPTEMLRAHRAGAPLQKLFPAPDAGPKYVKAILGPMPFLRIVPTSGVHENNADAYLRAGAFAVGFVNTLFEPTDLAAGSFDRIEERARRMLAAIGGARAPAPHAAAVTPA
jgi:Entner-Doudoroff aldolase